MPAICPKLERGAGRTDSAGPRVGEHTRDVLKGVLGLSDKDIDGLVASGAAGQC